MRLVLQAVCIMKQIKPVRVKDESGKMVEDYWPVSVKMVHMHMHIYVCIYVLTCPMGQKPVNDPFYGME